MLGCCRFPYTSSQPFRVDEVHGRVDIIERKARDARITAFALTIVTLVIMSAACALFGFGTLSPELTMGLGIFPYLAGTFLGAVGIGIFIGGLIHLATASVRDCQKRA